MCAFQSISSLNGTLDELTDQTKCKIKFTKNDMKYLHNKINTNEDLKIFTNWFNTFKDFYTPNLIVKIYAMYSQEKHGLAVSRMITLYNKLIKYHIVNSFNKMHYKTLYELQELIKNDNDWDMFYMIWREMKDDYCFGKILYRFKQGMIERMKIEAS